jgi:hypothetical protein
MVSIPTQGVVLVYLAGGFTDEVHQDARCTCGTRGARGLVLQMTASAAKMGPQQDGCSPRQCCLDCGIADIGDLVLAGSFAVSCSLDCATYASQLMTALGDVFAKLCNESANSSLSQLRKAFNVGQSASSGGKTHQTG